MREEVPQAANLWASGVEKVGQRYEREYKMQCKVRGENNVEEGREGRKPSQEVCARWPLYLQAGTLYRLAVVLI